MKKNKKKIVLYSFLIVIAVSILIYDTYQIHFSDRKKDNEENLVIDYENAGNILLSNIKNNSSISLKIKIKNNTDRKIYYKIAFDDVVNNIDYKQSITFTYSKEKGNIEIHSGVFPEKDIVINDGDEISARETVDYVVSVRANSIEQDDINKSIQARLRIIEIKE